MSSIITPSPEDAVEMEKMENAFIESTTAWLEDHHKRAMDVIDKEEEFVSGRSVLNPLRGDVDTSHDILERKLDNAVEKQQIEDSIRDHRGIKDHATLCEVVVRLVALEKAHAELKNSYEKLPFRIIQHKEATNGA